MGDPGGIRIRVLEDGSLEIVDPSLGASELLREIDPDFRVHSTSIASLSAPKLIETRARASGVVRARLGGLSEVDLREAHRTAGALTRSARPGEASLLDVKIEIAWRMLRDCSLCGHGCGVDRTAGGRGRCGLGADAWVFDSALHIAEEHPINPAWNITLRGCGLRCRFCQQHAALRPQGSPGERLDERLWRRVDLREARSLAFVGGNPTESLHAALHFLRAAPHDLAVPIAWNCSGYDGAEAIRLLDGVCDAYVPDFKYGNDTCAIRLSDAPGYVPCAEEALREMCRQRVPVFVRILVLPGHLDCCHLPSLARLQPLREFVWLHVLSQYAPDHLITVRDGPLARRPRRREVRRVREAALEAGFALV